MKVLVLLFLLVFFPLPESYAQELTLQECLDMALDNNSGLKAFNTDVLSSEEDVRISRTRLFPSLKLNGDYTILDQPDVITFKRDSLASSIPPQDVAISAENAAMYGLSLTVEQPLFTGGNLMHSVRKSLILNEEARHGFERQKTLLIFEVKKAFYEALGDQFRRKTMEKVIEAKRERLRVIRERYKEGYVQKEDLLTMETDLAAAELDLYKIHDRAQFDISKLKQLIYYKGSEEISLKEHALNFALTAILQEVKEAALTNSEDLKIAVKKIKAAGENIAIKQADYYPRASVLGRYTSQKETTITRPEVWMFSARIEWPIFEWNRTKSEVRKAAAEKQRLVYEQDELANSVMLEAEGAWRQVKEREREVEFQEGKLKSSEAKLNIAMTRYNEKVIKPADLIEAETEAVTAYDDYMSIITDLNIARARLEASAGVHTDKWFIEKETYSPHLASISKAVNDVFRRNPQLSESGDSKFLAAQKGPEQERSHAADAAPAEAVDVQKKGPPADVSYAIQAGSFKRKRDAEKMKKSLLKRIKEKRIRILRKSDFYKVRIPGFESREDAAALADRLGIKKYLIVKSRNGH